MGASEQRRVEREKEETGKMRGKGDGLAPCLGRTARHVKEEEGVRTSAAGRAKGPMDASPDA